MKEPEMEKIADWMKETAILCQKAETIEVLESNYSEDLAKLREEVKSLSKNFPVPSI